MANLVVGEREELAGYMLGLVKGIDRVITNIANDAAETAGVGGRYASILDQDEDVAATLDYVAQSLLGSTANRSPELSEPSHSPTADSTTTVIDAADTANRYAAPERVKNSQALTGEPSPRLVGGQALTVACDRLGRGA